MPPEFGNFYRTIKPEVDSKVADLRTRRDEVNREITSLTQEHKRLGELISGIQHLPESAQSLELADVPDDQPVAPMDFVHRATELEITRPTPENKKAAEETIVFVTRLAESGIDPFKKVVVKEEQEAEDTNFEFLGKRVKLEDDELALMRHLQESDMKREGYIGFVRISHRTGIDRKRLENAFIALQRKFEPAEESRYFHVARSGRSVKFDTEAYKSALIKLVEEMGHRTAFGRNSNP